jgi:tRNA(adenine34) deaminase
MFGIGLSEDEKFMRAALREAKKAQKLDEVPIGCVIVYDGQIIARGYNRRNKDCSTLAHAEMTAIRKASKKLGDWRLEGCTIYVTLEPCQMCAGAIVQARLDRVVIGCMNAKAGCCGSVINLLQMQAFNHQVEITKGVLEEESSSLISGFFRELREKKKREKELARAAAENGVMSSDSDSSSLADPSSLEVEENS